jgi:hypothetical protein
VKFLMSAGALNQNRSVLKRVWVYIKSLYDFDLTIFDGYRYKRLLDSQTPLLPRRLWPIQMRSKAQASA